MSREEEHSAFNQSLTALINRAIDSYKQMTVGDLIFALEAHKAKLMAQWIDNNKNEH